MSDAPDYYSRVNEDLLAAIPPSSARILEVGCGTGALASRFKRVNPRCTYWGVEADFEASEKARGNADLDEVFWFDIENSKYWELLDEFDCIVFGDVLEHLRNPHKVVDVCSNYMLSDGGSVVACVPNVQHWSVIQTLLNGDWPQHDEGLFDRTHLRYFTRKTIVEMFEGAGLTLSKIVPRNLAVGGERLVKAVRDAGLVGDLKQFREGVAAYQWLVHAIKADPPARRVLVRGFAAEGCCARPRLTEPGLMLDTVPGFRYSEVPAEVQPGESVVAVRQRFNITEEAVRTHLKHGHLIVGEWDDDPWYEGFRDKLKVPSVEWALKACHAVTVSTTAIARLVRPINPNVSVFRNHVAAVGPEREDVPSGVVTVYMGGQRRPGDRDAAMEFVNKIGRDNPEKIRFVVVHDRDLFEAIESENKTFYAFQPYEKYRALLRTCDVAILPLADDGFNRCKSDITPVECAAEGVLPILVGAKFFPGFCYGGGKMAHDVFSDLLGEGWDAAKTAAGINRDHVIEHRMLCDHYLARRDQYDDWLDRKPELDRQLFERLPELKEGE